MLGRRILQVVIQNPPGKEPTNLDGNPEFFTKSSEHSGSTSLHCEGEFTKLDGVPTRFRPQEMRIQRIFFKASYNAQVMSKLGDS